jgi:hypothetical protein
MNDSLLREQIDRIEVMHGTDLRNVLDALLDRIEAMERPQDFTADLPAIGEEPAGLEPLSEILPRVPVIEYMLATAPAGWRPTTEI